MTEKKTKHYYAGKSSIGINCSYESLNGTAWTAYQFETKEARDAWVLTQNDGYIGGADVVAKTISAEDARKIGYTAPQKEILSKLETLGFKKVTNGCAANRDKPFYAMRLDIGSLHILVTDFNGDNIPGDDKCDARVELFDEDGECLDDEAQPNYLFRKIDDYRNGRIVRKNMANKFWGNLNENEKETMLKLALPVSGIDGTTVNDGECIVDFIGCNYSIPGKVIDGEIVIDNNAVFYNPAE